MKNNFCSGEKLETVLGEGQTVSSWEFSAPKKDNFHKWREGGAEVNFKQEKLILLTQLK